MAQLSLPAGNLEENGNEKQLLPITLPNQVFQKVNKGLIFNYVIGLSAFRAVRLFPESEDSYENMLSNYTASTRRNEKKSDKVGNSLYLPTTTEQIKGAYTVIELNSENQGYSIRSCNDFGETLQFAAFQKLLPWVQKNKSKIANLLSKRK